MIALATVCAVSVLFRTVGQPFEVLDSAIARFRQNTFGRSDDGLGSSSSSSSSGLTFDSTISECLQQIVLSGRDQTKKGLPLLGVPPLDPLAIGPLYLTDDVDFFFRLHNVSVGGVTSGMTAKNMRLEYNTPDKRIYSVMEIPSIEIYSKYDVEIKVGRFMPAFFGRNYSITSFGSVNATMNEVDMKSYFEFKEEPRWGQNLEIDSTYVAFDFNSSTWTYTSEKPNDVLVKYLTLVGNNDAALRPILDVLRPTLVQFVNRFLYKTMSNIFKNVILI